MDTIMSYLNTMFATVAQTEQMQKIKSDLAANMEDKYNELKVEGKSENEAVGTVIAEFGNIDELLKDIGIAQPQEDVVEAAAASVKRVVTKEETDAYFTARARMNRLTAFGVMLILFGVSAMLLLFGIFDASDVILAGWSESLRDIIPIIILFITIVGAIPLFIVGGTQFEKYAYMEEGVTLPDSLRGELENRLEQDRAKNAMAVTMGVALCVLGVIILLILGALSEQIEVLGAVSVSILMLLIAAACYLFICPGGMKEGYEKVLGIGEFKPEKAKGNKIVGVVASIVWPIAVAVFLVWGLVYNGWHICWIIFPIVGICFGGFAAACDALFEK